MQARAVVFALTVLSCFAVSHAALSTEEIIDSIRLLTLDVKPMQNAADSINDESGQRILVGDGPFPKIIMGYTLVVDTATDYITGYEGTGKISDSGDAGKIADVFHEFAKVHQKVLDTLTVRAGMFKAMGWVGLLVRPPLQQAGSVLDTVAHTLVDILDKSASDRVKSDAAAMDEKLNIALKAYGGEPSLSMAKSRKLLL